MKLGGGREVRGESRRSKEYEYYQKHCKIASKN